MKNTIFYLLFFFLFTITSFSQSIDDTFSHKKMRKDLQVFKNIRIKANSGLYKYRTTTAIDSIYEWAEKEIVTAKTYRDFYNIICKLSDFEGSTHNSIKLPLKKRKLISLEKQGYFPYPIKLVGGKWILNFITNDIPVGAEIVAINGKQINEIIPELYKYYETDGINITGKRIGIDYHFSKYLRLNFGLQKSFEVVYKENNSNTNLKITLNSIGYNAYYLNIKKRFSKDFDVLDYTKSSDLKQIYSYKNVNPQTGILTINSFSIGENASSPEHLKFVKFLDSVFLKVKNDRIENLILDVRHNGGGTDPNELVTYEYLTNRNFAENKSAWISFRKIPYLKYIDSKIPVFLRFLGVAKYNNYFRKKFPKEINGKFYQDELSEDHKIRTPNFNAFKGKIYLLISSRVASAGSNFASLVASNDNTISVGEETQGGFYGHNGHTPLDYILPNSKIVTEFSIVNIEQFVVKKDRQLLNRGVIPDYNVLQSYEDYLNNTDTQINFVMDLIKKN